MRLIQDMPAETPALQSIPPWRQFLHSFRPFLSRHSGFFLLFNVYYGVMFAALWRRLLRFSLEQDNAPHGALIFLVSLYLLLARRQHLFTTITYWFTGGLALVIVGLLTYLLGIYWPGGLSQQDFFAMTTAGVVLVWMGGFVGCFGRQTARLALFPLGFLGFMIPLPEALLALVIAALQHASAEMVAILFQLTPVPVLREGLLFTLPGLSIEVASQCSSIRSSLALLITCVLASHLCLRRWWSTVVVLLLVFPLAVFKNGIRIVTLCLLSIYVDSDFMYGGLHTRGGAVFFGLSLMIFLGILLLLRKLEATRQWP